MNRDAVGPGPSSAAILDLPPLITASVGGGTVCYREAAGPSGAPVVVLLHGFLATSGLNWMHAFAPLSRHFRVIAPDLCGHGGDAFERRRFTLEHCADDVAALIVDLRLERVIIVGYSMGGMVAQHMARLHGRLISGMVLSGVDWGSRQYGRASTLLYPVFMEATLRMVRLHACLLRAPLALTRRLSAGNQRGREPGRLSAAAGEFSGHNPRAIGGATREITLFRSIDWLHEIDVPTTVLVTLRDNLFPPAEQRRMAKAIASARVREYDGGHVSARLPEYATALVAACLDVSARMAGRTGRARPSARPGGRRRC
jgi:pimeloyl-ACP methyl ester carboxylesterase